MGAWGYGHFENDAASDFVWEVEESNDPKQRIREALDAAITAEYVESDTACEAIAAAAYIDGQVNGTKFCDADGIGPIEVDTFPETHPNVNLVDLKDRAMQALRKVLTGSSELNELWAENEEDYPAWKQEIENMRRRLEV
jgi:hypothetical protein